MKYLIMVVIAVSVLLTTIFANITYDVNDGSGNIYIYKGWPFAYQSVNPNHAFYESHGCTPEYFKKHPGAKCPVPGEFRELGSITYDFIFWLIPASTLGYLFYKLMPKKS